MKVFRGCLGPIFLWPFLEKDVPFVSISHCIYLGNFPSKKRKRSRWNQDTMEQKTVIPGMPTVIPPGLTREQERAYIGKYTFCTQMHFQIVTEHFIC
uniref:Splicing factor 1 n=1 Tax=Ovis aries TaxID=9940 RepID=A0AC11CYG3_SHEEP